MILVARRSSPAIITSGKFFSFCKRSLTEPVDSSKMMSS
jgi:hypothetical protein